MKITRFPKDRPAPALVKALADELAKAFPPAKRKRKRAKQEAAE